MLDDSARRIKNVCVNVHRHASSPASPLIVTLRSERQPDPRRARCVIAVRGEREAGRRARTRRGCAAKKIRHAGVPFADDRADQLVVELEQRILVLAKVVVNAERFCRHRRNRVISATLIVRSRVRSRSQRDRLKFAYEMFSLLSEFKNSVHRGQAPKISPRALANGVAGHPHDAARMVAGYGARRRGG